MKKRLDYIDFGNYPKNFADNSIPPDIAEQNGFPGKNNYNQKYYMIL